jgi:hypothetical protein
VFAGPNEKLLFGGFQSLAVSNLVSRWLAWVPIRTLRRKMRQVIVILGVSIRRDDARWLDFGLNRPQRSLGEKRPAAVPAAGVIVETAALLSPETPSANDDVMAA